MGAMRRKENRYTDPMSVRFEAGMRARLDAAGERYGLPASGIVRRAVECGLRPALDRLRKERRPAGGRMAEGEGR